MSHYDTLGVAQNATPEEIKQAFRRLAKEYHPDVGGDAAKFQAISEAYEILINPDKKAHYDYTLKNPNQNFNQFQNQGFEFTHTFNDDVFRDISEQFSNMFGFNFRTAQQVPRNRNIRVHVELEFLETLNPTQKIINYKLTNGDETITLDFPAGFTDNTILQLAGRGDNANSAVPRGNLEVAIKVKPHPKFSRLDDHILSEVTISCFDAILGCSILMDTPRAKHIRLSIPAGTQHGTQFGITDEGYKRSNNTYGKLIITVNVKVPTALTQEQLNLVEQIQKLKPINT